MLWQVGNEEVSYVRARTGMAGMERNGQEVMVRWVMAGLEGIIVLWKNMEQKVAFRLGRCGREQTGTFS